MSLKQGGKLSGGGVGSRSEKTAYHSRKSLFVLHKSCDWWYDRLNYQCLRRTDPGQRWVGKMPTSARILEDVMAFIPLPYGIKLEMQYVKDGQICVNVWWLTKTTPSPVTDTDLTNAVNGAQVWWTNVRSSITSSCVASLFKATDWSAQEGGVAEITAPTGAPGTLLATNYPNNATIAFSFWTALRGRTRRGRFYLIGLSASNAAGQNVINAASVTDITAAYQAYKTAVNGNGLVPVVASFRFNKLPRVTGQGTAITAIGLVDGTFDSQRRRLPGRGQ